MKFNKNFLITGTVASALLLGACGGNASANDDENTKGSEASANTENTSVDASNILDALGDDKAAEAVQIAQDNFDGVLESISFEEEDGKNYYEINLESQTEEYEVTLDAEDLSVVEEDRENEDSNERSYNKLVDANAEDIISLQEAEDKAVEEAGGEVTDWQYDVDDLKYEFEIINSDHSSNDDDDDDDNNVDVEINAVNGELIEIDS